MKLKTCRKCQQDLPLDAFTSTQAKYCKNCKKIVMYEQKYERTKRQLERQKNKKRKKKVVKSIGSIHKQLQTLVNKYVRERDKEDGCISCKKNPVQHAGHYIAQGSSGALRYNLDNINGQCAGCNVWARGNLIEYRIALIEKIGKDRVEWLEQHRNDIRKWQRHELQEMIEEYKQKIKDMK